MKYAFIAGQRTQFPVRKLCAAVGVSRAGYYEWRGRCPSARSSADAALAITIAEIHRESRGTYGRRRVHAELCAREIAAGKHRVARLMRRADLRGITPRAFRKTTNSKHTLPIAENLLSQQFAVEQIGAANHVWAGDITYLSTREGWLYLAIVLDLGSRRVVGWSMRETMRTELVTEALEGALRDRRPRPGALFHSDRGSQYASEAFRGMLAAHGMTASMSATGMCWDNAAVESWFGRMKTELGDPIWESRDAARAAVFEYIEIWYNRRRRHSTLGYLTPIEYESRLPIAA